MAEREQTRSAAGFDDFTALDWGAVTLPPAHGSVRRSNIRIPRVATLA